MGTHHYVRSFHTQKNKIGSSGKWDQALSNRVAEKSSSVPGVVEIFYIPSCCCRAGLSEKWRSLTKFTQSCYRGIKTYLSLRGSRLHFRERDARHSYFSDLRRQIPPFECVLAMLNNALNPFFSISPRVCVHSKFSFTVGHAARRILRHHTFKNARAPAF